jgi:hypothetical protein
MKRLSPLLSLLLPLFGCTVGTSSDGDATTSIECVDDGGEVVCSEHEGDEAPDGDDGDLVCSDTGCVTHCEDGDGSSHCVTECEHGMRCETNCEGDACSMSCSCPDEGSGDEGGGGDDGGGDGCTEHPDLPECQDGGGDGGGDCPDGDLECYCQTHPDDAECGGGGGDGGGDCPDGDLECYCQAHPDDPECGV